MVLKRGTSCIVFFLFSISLFAQHTAFKFLVVNEEYGLAQDFVYTISQDNRGFTWVGTGSGLTRFDGRQTKNFLQEDGLAENFITASLNTSSGYMLYGHYNGRLSVFNGVFHRPLLADTLHSEITAIAEDRQHTVWCASKTGGLLRIQPGLEQHSLIFPGELQGKIIQDMLITGNQLVVGTNEGLYSFLISTTGLIFKDSPQQIQFEEIMALSKSGNDSLHIWAGSTAGTLYRVKTGVVSTTIESSKTINSENPSAILAIQQGHDNDLWVGTQEAGLIRLQLKDTKLIIINTLDYFNATTGFPIKAVKEIVVEANQVWVGTLSSGLVKIIRQSIAFTSLHPLGIDRLNDIYCSDGAYYLATNNGLYVYSKNNTLSSIATFQNQAILSVVVNDDSIIWVGTSNSGIIRYDQRTAKRITINLPIAYNEPIKARFMRLDKQGNCWVSAIGNGVYKLSAQGKLIKHLSTRGGFIHNDIFAIYPDIKGSVWFGSQGAGLAVLDANDSLQMLSQQGIFPSHDVNDITGDGKGNVWIATDGQGCFQFDGKIFTDVSPSTSKAIPFIKGIAYDLFGGLWITHRKGISFIDLATRERRDLSTYDGLRDSLSYSSTLVVGANEVLVNNESGFTQVARHKDLVQVKLVPVITAINLFFYEPLRISPTISEVKQQIFPASELDYNRNHLTFYFTAISKNYQGTIYYRYAIKELDRGWSPATTDNQVTYAALKPGNYTLQIQSTIDPSYWSTAPTAYTFSIKNPFWKQGWFYGIQLLILCLIFLATFYSKKPARTKAMVFSIAIIMGFLVVFEYGSEWLEIFFEGMQGALLGLKILFYFLLALALYTVLRRVWKSIGGV